MDQVIQIRPAIERIREAVAKGLAPDEDNPADSLRRLNAVAWLGERVPSLLAYIEAIEARNRELEAGSRTAAVDVPNEVVPPGDAWYAVVISGEGANAQVVEGWGSVLALVRHEMWMDGEAPADEWAEWLATFEDEDKWTNDEGGDPFRFDNEVGECSHLTIYRLANPPRPRQ